MQFSKFMKMYWFQFKYFSELVLHSHIAKASMCLFLLVSFFQLVSSWIPVGNIFISHYFVFCFMFSSQVRTLRLIIVPESAPDGIARASKRRIYLLLFIAVLQPLFMYFLTSHLRPVTPEPLNGPKATLWMGKLWIVVGRLFRKIENFVQWVISHEN